MKFAPRPENDFADYIRTYYEACRYHCDKIEAIAGKWMFRDLLPGMSDFDTRFIVNDGMTVDRLVRVVHGDGGDASAAVREISLLGAELRASARSESDVVRTHVGAELLSGIPPVDVLSDRR